MKKVVFPVLLAIALIFSAAAADVGPETASGHAETGIALYLFGEPAPPDLEPRMYDGVTMVPLRSFAEALGAKVEWNGETQTATVTKGDSSISIEVNRSTALKNGREFAFEGTPRLIGGSLFVPVRLIGETFDTMVRWDSSSRAVYIEELPSLPVVGSYEKLKELVAEVRAKSDMAITGFELDRAAVPATSAANEMKAEAKSAAEGASADYSATNVQVRGVDEADVVKTDGKYIYQVNQKKVIIAQADPAEQLHIAATVDFRDQPFTPRELYVDNDRLIVIGSSYYKNPDRSMQTTKAVIFDISSITAPKQLREVELEGHYVSSRKIGSALYMVTNKYIDYYRIMDEKQQQQAPAPAFRDTASGDGFINIDYNSIRYFPDSIEPNYLLVAGIDLAKDGEKADVSAYLGSGRNIYASQKHLYITVTRYEPANPEPLAMERQLVKPVPPVSLERKSVIYKFRLDHGKIGLIGRGEVPGTVLNQFSMDEHNGYLRIATTTGEVWRTDEYTSKNHIYILDEGLKLAGKLEDIAPGEKIYSVRFMGDRGYMVTFKTVDPLFVVDLKDPHAPKILGALKIPGYSDYLHPYDENHIIGFGKDTVEVAQKNGSGESTTTAFYQGMKIALFDVSDVSNPVEKFKEMIGDRGTHSELLHNHKALLFSKEKHLLAFPVTVMEVKNKQPTDLRGFPAYGEFTFQGAYVYHLDLDTGFTLRGKISHFSEEQLLKSGRGWYDTKRNVERILYINNNLYTLSKGMIKANDLTTLEEKGSLVIP